MNKKLLLFLMLFSVSGSVAPACFSQTTTADGSLPGGVNNSERMRAEADPFVKKNRESLKRANLDPVALERYTEKLMAKSSSQQSFLQTSEGDSLSLKGQILIAFLFAKQNGLKATAMMKQMEKGTPLFDAIREVALANGKNKNASAPVVTDSGKTDNDVEVRARLQALARTVQDE